MCGRRQPKHCLRYSVRRVQSSNTLRVMGSAGLNTSIWASRGNVNPGDVAQTGDWHCPSCTFFNYHFRNECLRCRVSRSGTPRATSPARIGVQQSTTMPPSDTRNGFSNQHQSTSNGLTAPMIPASVLASANARAEKGLADSLWAPRNHSGRARKADTSQIWRRVRSSTLIFGTWLT